MHDPSFAVRYPFSREAKDLLREEKKTLEDILKEKPHLIERAKRRVIAALIGKTPFIERERDGEYDQLLLYPLTIMLVRGAQDGYLTSRFASYESKRLHRKLENEREENILKLAYGTFEINVLVVEEVPSGGGLREIRELYLPLKDYLSLSKRFRDPIWKLTNRKVTGGAVKVHRHELIRLMAEAYRLRLLKSGRMKITTPMPKSVLEAIDEIRARLITAKSGRTISYTSRGLPPCLEDLLGRISNHEDLSHTERVVVASFLLNKGVGVEEVIKTFANLPDFDEEKTRYQVEHLAGLRGSKKKYSAPSCKTMRSYGLCRASEACRGVNHPLQFGRKRTIEVEQQRAAAKEKK